VVADTVAAPVEGFTVSAHAVEETAALVTGGLATTLAESALLCHVEHARLDLSERSILA